MNKNSKIDRRSFIKTTAQVAAFSAFGGSISNILVRTDEASAFVPGKIDIAAVQGNDYFKSTIKAIDLLGGMNRFVTKGSKVGLLINSPWINPGSYTNPDIALAVIKMCYDNGAKEIWSIENAAELYWRRSKLFDIYSDEVKGLKGSKLNHKVVKLSNAKNLKEAHVKKELLECDLFINIPIFKDHIGTWFSGSLKNMMGACLYNPTNHFIHFGDTGRNWKDGGYKDVEYLSQSIADLGLVRKPDLCIADATEILVSNGPAGPGKINKPKYVVAGTDWLALDAYGTRFVNKTGKDIVMLKRAVEHKLGNIDISNLNIRESTLS